MNDDNKTRIITPTGKPQSEQTDVATRVFRGGEAASAPATSSQAAATNRTRVITGNESASHDPDMSHDLAVGWIVIVDGPGRGCTKEIFYGMNSIGRDVNERIPLDFGDANISRSSHAFLVFDEKQNEFFIQHGGKSNLVRLNDAPVLSPMQINHGDIIELGATKLMFVPLCGKNFKWEDDQN